MNETAAHKTSAQKTSARMDIDPWTDRLGGLLERYPRLWTRLGDLETRLVADRLDAVAVDRPIYVTGLARSGTTVLLELLALHPDTVAHRYRDFPLVLTPWAWNWFVDRAGRGEAVARERAHRDRITVTSESPEAFEEVIWMTFFPDIHDPGRDAALGHDTSHPAFEAFYRDHIRKLLALRGGSRYLAKGNYNVTRLPYLHKLFPDARFVVPIRDPQWHIASLMKQHRLFAAAEREDERVLRHMRRSGHFEFGLGRRPIDVGDGAAEVTRLWAEGEEVEGWAAHWALVYGHVADRLAADPDLAAATLVVRYEDFCSAPAEVMARVLDHCALAPGSLPEAAAARISAPDYYQPDFTEEERATIARRTAAVAGRFGYG